MVRKKLSDKELLYDLFHASAPGDDEHRLAFTIRFSPTESDRIKKAGSLCYSEALRTVKGIVKGKDMDSPAIDVIITLERNRLPYNDLNTVTYGLHAHGWLRSRRSFTAADLDDRINNKTRGKKLAATRASSSKDYNPQWDYDYPDPYRHEDDYIPMDSGQHKFVFDPKLHPVDDNWVAYIAKEFDSNPKWSSQATHKFSATAHTKGKATEIRETRSKKMDSIVRSIFKDTIANYRDIRRQR